MEEIDTTSLTNFKNHVLDVIIRSGTILVLIGMVGIFLRDYPDNITISFYSQVLLVFATCLLAIYVKRVKLWFKVAFILVGLTTILINGLFHISFLASAKVYIVLAPVLISFATSFRKSLITLIILTVIYSVFAYLYVNQFLVADINVSEHILKPSTWFSDGIILFLSAFSLLFIGSRYQDELLGKAGLLKKQTKVLQKSEERYKKLVMAFPDIIMVSDLNGNIVYGNEHLKQITGITENDYKNPKRKAHIHPDDTSMVKKAMDELIKGTETQSGLIEIRVVDTWGKLHWFSGTLTKLYIDNELHIQIVSRDITEKKLTEIELAKHQNNLEHLVEEQTKNLSFVNEELSAKNTQLSEQGQVISAQNIELKQTLKNLNETQNQLIHSEKMASLGVLTAGVAHEINNPLNYILGSQVGLEDYFEDTGEINNEKIQRLLNGLKTGVERTNAIVRSLNQFSRNNETLDEDCKIHKILDNCLAMINNQLKYRVVVDKNYNAGTAIVKGNVGKLHQVFLNILTNSSQAITKKGTITISTAVVKNKMEIAISDSGEGMENDELNKITDPFYTTKEPGKGTGLGLSISYSIIQEHKGAMHFESDKGKGTKVTILLPLNN